MSIRHKALESAESVSPRKRLIPQVSKINISSNIPFKQVGPESIRFTLIIKQHWWTWVYFKQFSFTCELLVEFMNMEMRSERESCGENLWLIACRISLNEKQLISYEVLHYHSRRISKYFLEGIFNAHFLGEKVFKFKTCKVVKCDCDRKMGEILWTKYIMTAFSNFPKDKNQHFESKFWKLLNFWLKIMTLTWLCNKLWSRTFSTSLIKCLTSVLVGVCLRWDEWRKVALYYSWHT